MHREKPCFRALLVTVLVSLSTALTSNVVAGEKEMSSGRWVIRSEKPAKEWEHGLLTGNGRHGARVMGHPGNDRIICTHEELFVRFWDRKIMAVADIAHLLPQVRRLIDEGKEGEARDLAMKEGSKQLAELGVKFPKAVVPHPAFDLNVQVKSTGEPSDYQRELDLETGEALSRWKNGDGGVEQRVFSSRKHNVNVVQLKGTGGRKLDVTLSLTETPGRRRSIKGVNRKDYTKPPKSTAASGWLYYDADYGFDPGGYEGVARVTTQGGKTSSDGSKLHVTGADEILIVIRIHPQKEGTVSRRDSLQRELRKLPAAYWELFVPHAREHGEMFRRVVLDLGAARQWATTSTEQLLTLSKERGVTALFLEQIHAMGR